LIQEDPDEAPIFQDEVGVPQGEFEAEARPVNEE
jgi:hypothetical protein